MPHADPGPDINETAASMLEAMFTSSPVGLHLLDPHLRVVRINTATPTMRGVPLENVVGRPARDVFDIVEGNDMEALLRKVLDTGVPLRERIVRAVTRADPCPSTLPGPVAGPTTCHGVRMSVEEILAARSPSSSVTG
ncbi:PAS domain-containing protein [Streptomyces sp. NPDC001698]|uniref:PAS domain-containing protein n=1 Tax=Streptomyces sp. NPDC001698 TaxID=3364601 RepID=UPI00369C3B41